MKKRGVVDLQFNWIFVLIAGAVILAIFFAVANSLKQSSDDKIDLEVSTDLKSILIGAKVSTDSSNVIPIPSSDITIEADGIKVGALQSIKLGTVFGPHKIEGNKMIVWSRDWSIPFRIANFLYVTSPKVKYYFVVGSSISPPKHTSVSVGNVLYDDITDFLDDIPKDVNVETVEKCVDLLLPTMQFSKAMHIRVVVIGEVADCKTMINTADNLYKIKEKLKSHPMGGSIVDVKLFEGTDTFESGTVDIWSRWPGTAEESFSNPDAFYGDATLYGAIFSDPKVYEQSMNVAMTSAGMVFTLYSRRTSALTNWAKSESFSTCESIYGSAHGEFNALSSMKLDFLDTKDMVGKDKDGNEIVSSTTKSFYETVSSIEGYNNEAQVESCPSIY